MELKQLVLGGLALITVGSGYFAFLQYHGDVIASNNKVIQANNAKIKDLNNQKNDLTVAKYETVFEQQVKGINLDTIENDYSNQVKSAFDSAYNSKSVADFNKIKPELTQKLGDNLSQVVSDNIGPTSGQAGDVLMTEKLNNIEISFGKFDLGTNNLPVMVVVDYNLPAKLVQPSDGSPVNKDALSRKGLYTFSYNIKTKQTNDVAYKELVKGSASDAQE